MTAKHLVRSTSNTLGTGKDAAVGRGVGKEEMESAKQRAESYKSIRQALPLTGTQPSQGPELRTGTN